MQSMGNINNYYKCLVSGSYFIFFEHYISMIKGLSMNECLFWTNAYECLFWTNAYEWMHFELMPMNWTNAYKWMPMNKCLFWTNVYE